MRLFLELYKYAPKNSRACAIAGLNAVREAGLERNVFFSYKVQYSRTRAKTQREFHLGAAPGTLYFFILECKTKTGLRTPCPPIPPPGTENIRGMTKYTTVQKETPYCI
jgi:hypothetical protein